MPKRPAPNPRSRAELIRARAGTRSLSTASWGVRERRAKFAQAQEAALSAGRAALNELAELREMLDHMRLKPLRLLLHEGDKLANQVYALAGMPVTPGAAEESLRASGTIVKDAFEEAQSSIDAAISDIESELENVAELEVDLS